jgi:hypothetical protein
MLSKTILLIEHHTPCEHIGPVWDLLMQELERAYTDVTERNDHHLYLLHLLDLLRVFVSVRKGTRVPGKMSYNVFLDLC